jgi:glycosyltransferase involved in cell wall biosynthesis
VAVSVVVFNRNNAIKLKRALRSAAFADEVVVIDSFSQDDSVEVARKLATKVVSNTIKADYVEPIRNFGVKQATCEWVLVLDADEEVPGSLASELLNVSKKGGVDAWYIPRINMMFGQKVKTANWWPDYQLRFFKQGAVEFSPKIHSEPTIKGKADYLAPQEKLALIHHNYDSMEEYIDRLNHYTTIEASQMDTAEPVLTTFFADFIRRFYAQKGSAGGEMGAYLSLAQAFYQATGMMKYRLQEGLPHSGSGQMRRIVRELSYWQASEQVNRAKTPWGKLYWRGVRWLKR